MKNLVKNKQPIDDFASTRKEKHSELPVADHKLIINPLFFLVIIVFVLSQ